MSYRHLRILFLLLASIQLAAQDSTPFSLSGIEDSISLDAYAYVLEDPQNAYEISDVRELWATFEPLEQLSRPLNEESTYWVYLPLIGDTMQAREWILFPDWGPNRFRIGLVDAYILGENGRVVRKKTGQYYPASEKEHESGIRTSIRNQFFFSTGAGEPTTLFLRFRQVNHMSPAIHLLIARGDFGSRYLQDDRWYIWQAVFQGMLWIMVFYSLASFFTTRRTSYASYVLFLVVTAIYMLYLSGVLQELFLQERPYWGPYIWIVVSNLMAIAYFNFARHFLYTRELIPVWDRVGEWIVRGVFILMLIELAYCHFTMNLQNLNHLVNATIIVEVSFMLLILVVNLKKLKVLALIFGFGTLAMILAGFAGVFAEALLHLESVLPFIQIMFVIQILTFSIGLSYQYRQSEREKLAAQKLMNENLIRTDQLKDIFLANTSHELRTPLQGILGLTEAIADNFDRLSKSEIHRYLATIQNSGRRLTKLVDDILDFSRLKTRDIKLKLKPIDLRSTVEVVLSVNAPIAQRKNLNLHNEVPADLPAVLADEDRLQQILFNLIGNALKFTPKGKVRVAANQKDGMIRLGVEDTGVGIPAEKHQVIFQAFEQGDGAAIQEYAGTGLGLSVTKSLVELHGGNIDLESYPGKGTTFFVTLPIADKPAERASRYSPQLASIKETEKPAEISSLAVGSDFRFRILIVDDESINHEVIGNYLREGSYQVTSAFSGSEALDLLDQGEPFDLILLDVMMPNLSGYEVCKRIRERFLPSELPVIFITAKNQLKDLIQGLGYGANDYLAKPFSKAEFLARLKTHLHLHHIYGAASKFIPLEFIRSLERNSILEVELGDHRERDVTVFFSDIRSYTTLAEQMTPHENYLFVNAYAGRMGPVIKAHHGFVHQYLGDGIMALFLQAADDAVLAAVEMQATLRTYNEQRKRQNRRPLQVGMGLHTGSLIMGIIGDKYRNDPGVISDTVNTASRMEGLTKYFGAPIIISEYTLQAMKDADVFSRRYLGKVQVKGKVEPIGIYEILDGEEPETRRLKKESAPDLEKGLQAYYDRQFEMAALHFKQILTLNPEDTTARNYLTDAAHFMVHGAPEDWSGVVEMKSK